MGAARRRRARGRRRRGRRLARPRQGAGAAAARRHRRSASPGFEAARRIGDRHLRAAALPGADGGASGARHCRRRSARCASASASRRSPCCRQGADAAQRGSFATAAASLAGSRSGGPWPKQTSAGSSAAMRRADSRLSATSGLKDQERLADRAAQQERVEAPHHVAAQQRAVRLAPEGDVAGGVARRLEHREAGDLVALAQPPRDRMRGRARDHAPALPDHLALLDGLHVGGAAPQRDAEPVADRVARAVVVGMRVRERVRCGSRGLGSASGCGGGRRACPASSSTSPIT